MGHGQPAGEEDDARLVRRARRGDQRAFSVLCRRHEAWLVRYLYGLLGSSQDAEDVAQDAFVRAFAALDRFEGRSSVRTWLRTIATRLAFNRRRDAAARTRYEELPERRIATPDSAAAVEARQILDLVLARLAYPYREILVLRYLEELDVREVGRALGISQPAAKMRLLRARDQFRAVYDEVSRER